MSLAFGRYSARSGVRARGPTERRSKPGQPCTHGINLGVKNRTSLCAAWKTWFRQTCTCARREPRHLRKPLQLNAPQSTPLRSVDSARFSLARHCRLRPLVGIWHHRVLVLNLDYRETSRPVYFRARCAYAWPIVRTLAVPPLRRAHRRDHREPRHDARPGASQGRRA